MAYVLHVLLDRNLVSGLRALNLKTLNLKNFLKLIFTFLVPPSCHSTPVRVRNITEFIDIVTF